LGPVISRAKRPIAERPGSINLVRYMDKVADYYGTKLDYLTHGRATECELNAVGLHL
jgi:hypothetical protein